MEKSKLGYLNMLMQGTCSNKNIKEMGKFWRKQMKEIGGYIELDTYNLPMRHNSALALNCGRNCLAFLIQVKKIHRIMLPYFLCSSVQEVCRREGVEMRFYHVDSHFYPEKIRLLEDEWLYVVNYYGQLKNIFLAEMAEKYKRVIIDNAQAFYQDPISGIDTIYTCRKFFGVADGAFLYTDAVDTFMEEKMQLDESYDRMRFILGRFERTASEFYSDYVENNEFFADEPVKRMSKLTENLLHGIDYETVKKRRTSNFQILHEGLRAVNRLELSVPEGAFMYPLYVEGGREMRRRLREEKIFIPVLWPDAAGDSEEADMAENILPLPVDQRYGEEEMKWILKKVMDMVGIKM